MYAQRDYGFGGVDIVKFTLKTGTTKTEFLVDMGPSDLESWKQFVATITQGTPSNYKKGNQSISCSNGVVTFKTNEDNCSSVITLELEACLEYFNKLTEALSR